MGLTGRFLTASVLAGIAASTSSAGTMMERIGVERKGGCHKAAVEKAARGIFMRVSEW